MKTKILVTTLALTSLFLVPAHAQVTVNNVVTNGLAEPYNVVEDANNNVYVSDSANNRIVRIDASSQAQTVLAGIAADPPGSNDGPSYLAHFNSPEGLLAVTFNGDEGVLVSDNGNSLIRFVRFSDGNVITLAGQVGGGPANNSIGLNATFMYPRGLDQDGNGNVYIADWGNNTVRVMNLNDPNLGVTNLVITGTTLYRPTSVAFAGTNQLWIADGGNQQVKLITLATATTGSLSTYVGSYRSIGTTDSSFGPSAQFNAPGALLWVNGVGLLISDSLNNSIRLATNYTAFGPTNYAVTTFAGMPPQAGFVNGSPSSSMFNSPYGLAFDVLNNGFLVSDLKNNAIRRVQIGAPLPPVPTPQIGWVLFVKDQFGDYVSSLQVGPSFVFNNDVIIAILGTDGTETHFTFGPTPANPLQDTIPNPTSTVGSTPGVYRNGVHAADVPPSIIQAQPDITVKAIGFETGRQNSSIGTARFQFKVGAPLIQGNNAALFTVNEQTVGAALWYTIDGTDPTNAAPSIGPILTGTNGVNLSINAPSNFTFKIRGFRDNYQPSEIASQDFSVTNFNATKISFGFRAGEASSDFIAAPGQFFFAPVTLSLLSGVHMYSLQFNLTVTNAGPNPGPAVAPGAVGFESFLEKPIPGTQPPIYERIPPLSFLGNQNNPPPPSSIVLYDGRQFVNMMFTNSNNGLNLLGVGWLERLTQTNLYNTTLQDLIKYSQPHDTMFLEDNSLVVVGGYAFQVPVNAVDGQTYQIQIGLPSATSDGIGGPGGSVYIATPTNGSLYAGDINAIKVVTVGQRKYTVGDSAPFRWFNAGDFGDTNLDNSDVMQVFQSAVYTLDNPPSGSDFFDSMDSCGLFGITNPVTGYLMPDTNSLVNTDVLYNGNDTTINCLAFGDGVLDVCDVYVTFRRSLDPTLTWVQRFWTTNGLAATYFPGRPTPLQCPAGSPLTNPPAVSFASADLQVSAGQTVQVPVTANMVGSYPLRVAMLSVSINPLDGSPPLTSSIQFTPNPALGTPTLQQSSGPANYAAAWLNSQISGVTGNATLGTLTVTVPTNATSASAYAIHFDHASASPNGIASFPKKTRTGLLTLSDRSTSSYGDGIPDSWRLRYFGTVNNLLSQAGADADGDGANNWQEYIAGTDPTDAKSFLRVSTDQAAAVQKQDCVIHWPSVTGKSYIIERSPSLFSPSWSPITTNAGTGADMEFHDTAGGNVRFYRVRVQ